jgi:hypothetical protein
VTVTPFSGHQLLWQLVRPAAKEWKFEKDVKQGWRSLIIGFFFESGNEEIVEKNEKATEEVLKSNLTSSYVLNVRIDTLVPKLLLLPREKGVLKSGICELHDEKMEVEVQEVTRVREEVEFGDFWDEYSDAKRKEFPNACEKYYGYYLSEATKKAETYYCKSCRINREKWFTEYKKNNSGI